MSEELEPPQLPPAPNHKTPSEDGQSVDDGRGRIFPCTECGADFEFHIGEQQLKCPYCGFVKQIEIDEDREIEEQNFQLMLENLRDFHKVRGLAVEGQHEVRCESCGGQAVFVGSLTSDECAFCGSPIQRDDVHDAPERVPVDGVMGFRVERSIAQTNLKDWVKSRWFAPNEFRARGVKGQFNGVYLPYWTFDSLTFTRYKGQRGEHYYVTVGSGKNKRRVRKTRWWSASGKFQRFFDDVMVLAVQGMNRKLMRQLEPWPLADCVPFTQEMLAGFLARTYEIELEDGFKIARERIDDALRVDVRSRIGGDEQRIDKIDTKYDAITYKHLLLPVWLLAYRFRDQTYQIMVNAVTGEVQGERPYSWVKITLAIVSVLAVFGTIFLLSQR